MRVNQILSSILGAPLLIYAGTAEAMLPALDLFLQGKPASFFFDDDEEEQESPLSIFAIQEGQLLKFSSLDDAPEGSVAVISLRGVMMREDYCGAPGTQTLSTLFKEAFDHPNIMGVVHDMNTGGGTVDGTEAFAGVIAGGSKPVVGFVRGMMASAGVWVGAQSNYIMLEGKSSMVGSIGTQISLSNRTEYYQKLGIKEELIRATDSTDKNEDVQQALKGNYKPLREEILDPLNNVFLSSVRESRAGKLKGNNALTGKMFVGDLAIAEGLADGYGTLEDAVAMVMQLAEDNPTSPENLKTNSNTMKNPFKAKTDFPKLSALAAKKGEEISAEEVSEANEELATAGASIAVLTEPQFEQFESAVSQNATLAAANQQLAADLATMTASRDQFQQQAEALGQARPDDVEDPKAEEADKIASTGKKGDESWNSPDFSFNKAADNSRIR